MQTGAPDFFTEKLRRKRIPAELMGIPGISTFNSKFCKKSPDPASK